MAYWESISICFVLFEFFYELYFEYRQYRHIKRQTEPAEIYRKDVSKESFQKSKDYELTLMRLQLPQSIISIILVLITICNLHKFWCFIKVKGEIIHTLILNILSTFFSTIINIPFSYYKTFVIDEKFGFNKSTKKLFFTDKIKSFLVGIVLESILYSIIIFIYRKFGENFIIIASIVIFALMIILQVLYPILIMPLFTKLSPIQEGEIKDSIMKLAKETNFNIKEIYQTDDSKRSTKQNAFTFGLFTHKVALADTLIEKCTTDDIVAVLGHEIGHSKHHHIFKSVILNQINLSIILFSIAKIMKSDSIFADFGFTDSKPLAIGMMLLSFLSIPITKVLNLPLNLIIRSFEYQADEFAARRKLKIDTALIKLCNENNSVIESDPLYSALNESHPTLAQRVQAIHKIQAKLC